MATLSMVTKAAPDRMIHGLVCDSISHTPVPFAAIYVSGTDGGVLADDNGRFSVTVPRWPATLRVSVMGYTPRNVTITPYNSANAVIGLLPEGIILDEINVKPRKEHYSKKNNPAVELMRRIAAASDMTDPRRNAYYNYDKYERLTIALNDFHAADSTGGNAVSRQFGFAREYTDTSDISGKPILPLSVKEKTSHTHYRRAPEAEREVVTAIRRSGIDEITDQESMQTLLEDVFREIDLYENDVTLLQNRFVSPLSRIAPDFYKFYLTDTIPDNSSATPGDSLIELSFAPRNPAMFGFIGRLYVTAGDSTMFIRKAVMNLPPSANVNFVEKFYISQEFVRAADGSRLKTRDDITAELRIMPGTPGFYARRNSVFTAHDFNPAPDSTVFDDSRRIITAPDAYGHTGDYWVSYRPLTMGHGERNMEAFISRMRAVPLYYWTEKILKVLVSGYISTGQASKWDFGPMNTTVSFNDIEGLRLKAGGMTTANLSRRWFGRTYVAYGTKDHRWKYKGEVEYSFVDKRYHSREFPIKSLRLTHMYDIDMLGQHYMFTNPDNVFLSLKRQSDTQMTYRRLTRLEYTLEMHNNFSITARLDHERQEATRYMTFVDGHGNSHNHYNETSLHVQLRYAPGEKFYQTKSYRIPVNLDAPVFMLSHTIAPHGFAGNSFAINKTEASIQKRFWFSSFGYLDGIVSGGHVWSRSPYPNLLIPNANLSYTIQPESYALMNAMEFINDSYVSWDLTYWANGAILNYIPGLKRLKLREAFSFRGLWGDLSQRNDPRYDNALYRFPADAHTRLMTDTPYMEAGVGLDNIFRILRVDYVWRLTYRDTPGCNRSGVRIALHFTF